MIEKERREMWLLIRTFNHPATQSLRISCDIFRPLRTFEVLIEENQGVGSPSV